MSVVSVTLNRVEMRVAAIAAEGRQNPKQAAGIPDGKHSTRPGLEVNFEGVCGEMAVARVLNFYFPIRDSLGGDGGRGDLFFFDPTMNEKINIGIKCPAEGRRFLFGNGKQGLRLFADDYAVLAWHPSDLSIENEPKDTTFAVVGFLSRDEALEKAVWFEKIKDPCYSIYPFEFRSILDFREEIWRRRLGVKKTS